jgi:hypothetical protein
MIHPGFVLSKNDGDRHFIGVRQLLKLYGLKPSEAVVCLSCQRRDAQGCLPNYEYVHLFPRYDGDYSLPAPKP